MQKKEDLVDAHDPAPNPASDWCCMYCVLLLQGNFVNEKPMIQHHVEGQGHTCLFLPKFHCELNLIEMLWGFMKYSKSLFID